MKHKKSFKKEKQLIESTVAETVQTKPVVYHSKLKWILFALGFILYANTVPFDYALDDKIVITENQFTKKGISGISDILSYDSMVGFFGVKKNLVAGGRYRPLALITHAIEWEFFKENPHISHLVNALLYALCCLLLYLLLVQIFPPNSKTHPWLTIPFIAVLIFAVHPLHTEVVANIKGRDDMLSLLFALPAFIYSLKLFEKFNLSYAALAFVCFFLSLMAKESSIIFLAVIPLSYYFFRQWNFKNALVSLVPIAIASAAYLYLRYQVIGSAQIEIAKELMNNPFLDATDSQKYATIFYTLILYIKLLILPHPLTHDYYPKQIPIVEWSEPLVILSLLLHAYLAIVCLQSFRKKSVLSYGILFYFISFSLYSNILFPIGTFMNERFLFIPSIGFAIIVAYYLIGFLEKKQKLQRQPIFIVFALIMLAYSGKTIARNYAWQNDNTLALADIKTSANSAKANMSAGLASFELAKSAANEREKKKLLDESVKYLSRSLEIYPTYMPPMLLMGNTLSEMGDFATSIVYYENCLKMNPNYDFALQNLEYVGDKNREEKNYAISAKAYETIVNYNTTNIRVLGKLGELYGRELGDLSRAEKILTRAYEVDPNDTGILQKLGIVYAMTGNPERALEIFKHANSIDPANPRVLLNLGLTYSNLGQLDIGQEYINKAFEMDPSLRTGQ
jgi:tetratricopeptide (TPR) repeat protein